MVRNRLGFLLAACFCFLNISPASAEEDESHFLKGKVMDNHGKPVNGAKIVVHDEDHDEYHSGKSNANGEFEVEHTPCHNLAFDVLPPVKLALSPAHYGQVKGELSKHFIVQLRQGFKVSGRILSGGQPLKGIDIKFNAHDQSARSDTIHGGGYTSTKGDGTFSLLLAPGKKIMEIRNDRYKDLSPLYQHEANITGETTLPEISLPPRKN